MMVLGALALCEKTLRRDATFVARRIMQFTAFHLIQSFEACRLEAYVDASGKPTIGWGHTEGVKIGDTCTQQQADLWLKQDVEWAQGAVNSVLTSPVPQGVFDALVDLTYNVGDRVLHGMVTVRALRREWQAFCTVLASYVHDKDGVVLPGLVRRRKAEIALVEASIPGFKYQGAS
jgi:lysozyme